MEGLERYERALSEPQVNRLLIPTERWSTAMGPAAAELLKRLQLVPTHKGGRNKKSRGAKKGLLLTFDGAPDKPKGFTYLKCSRRIRVSSFDTQRRLERNATRRLSWVAI